MIFPLAKAPLLITLIVFLGTTLCVSNLPAILILIPDKKEGIIVNLFFLFNLVGFLIIAFLNNFFVINLTLILLIITYSGINRAVSAGRNKKA